MASAVIRSELIRLSPEIDAEKSQKVKWSPRLQFCATFLMDLLAFSFGATSGWTSSSIPYLQSQETPLSSGPISISEGSWIASFICPGGFFGNVIIGMIATRIGQKFSLCIVAVCQIIGWLTLFFAKIPLHLIFSRFISGFAGGGLYSIVPSFIYEISDDRVRGNLGSTVVFSCNLGILFAFLCGEYIEYLTIPWLMLPASFIFLFLSIKVPDSPMCFIRKEKYEQAEKSLIYYRNMQEHSKHDLQCVRNEIQKLQDSNDVNISLSLKDFKTKYARKAIIYGITLMFLNQFCGVFAMINFTSTIFQQAGSNLSPNVSAIIVAVIQIVGSLVPALLVDRLGRRKMMLTSSLGTSLGLATLGLFILLKVRGFNVENFNVIPLISFSFLIFISNCGVLTLPFMIISEISHPKIREFVSVLCMSFLWIFGFIAIKCLPSLMEVFDMSGTMFIFACNSLIGFMFILIFLPETKGKSYEEIIEILSR